MIIVVSRHVLKSDVELSKEKHHDVCNDPKLVVVAHGFDLCEHSWNGHKSGGRINKEQHGCQNLELSWEFFSFLLTKVSTRANQVLGNDKTENMDCHQEVHDPESLISVKVDGLNGPSESLCFDLVSEQVLVFSDFISLFTGLIKAQTSFLCIQNNGAKEEKEELQSGIMS